MEPFSAAAAAITLCPVVIGITRSFRNGYKSVKYARRELEELTNDMDMFTDLYSEFLKACSTRKKHRKRVSSAKKRLVSWTKQAILDFKKLLHKVDALARDPIYKHTVAETAFAHCKWYFSKNHLGYLRASLNVARQSMVGFTNVCNIELLDEQLAHLKSVITPQQRQEIEKEYGMPLEQHIAEVQGMRDTYELQQSEIPHRLKEASEKVKVYQKQTKDDKAIEHTRQILTFSKSVNRYVDHVLPLDESGNRPPRPSPRSINRQRPYSHNSSLMSQSTATTQTQSSRPSHHQRPAPESPPTSPEPFIADPPVEIQPEEEETTSILNFCQKCSGTCTNTEAHNTSIRHPPLDAASHTIWCVPNTAPEPSSEQASNTTRSRPFSHARIPPIRRMQPSNSNQIPPSSSRLDTHQRHPSEPSIEPAGEATANSCSNPTAPEGDDEEHVQAGATEEETSTDGQARDAGTSIWRATGAFGGHMPRNLRERRRQRSRSPWR